MIFNQKTVIRDRKGRFIKGSKSRLNCICDEETKKKISEGEKTGTYLNCQFCNKPFYSKKSHLYYRECCSRSCAMRLKQQDINFKLKQLQSVLNNRFRKGKKSPKIAGKNHWNWQEGITPINAKIRNSLENKLWREAVFKRDNFACQICGKTKVYLHSHHIKSWSKYPELRFDISNGLTLCRNCHLLTKNYGGRND